MNPNHNPKDHLTSALPKRLVGGALTLLAAIFLAAAVTISVAKEKDTTIDGLIKCVNWCDAHNKTSKSYEQCAANCRKYWIANGSDAPPPAPTKTSPTPAPKPVAVAPKQPPRKLGH